MEYLLLAVIVMDSATRLLSVAIIFNATLNKKAILETQNVANSKNETE